MSAGSGESGSANEPFVETPAGGLFFLNAVLAAPALLVLAPVVVRGLLRGIGAIEGPTALLDPVPAVAAYAGPWVAWLSVVPLWTSWHNLRMPLPSPARWALRAFFRVVAPLLDGLKLEGGQSRIGHLHVGPIKHQMVVPRN